MSEKNKITIPIAGMHCRSCEMLIEKKLSEIPEVERSVVSYKKGTAEIHYAAQKPNEREIEEAIRAAGYVVGTSDKKPFFSRNASDYKDLGIALLFLLGAYVALKSFGITNLKIGGGTNPSSLSVVFLVGITAGLSTCMALVGGLILGISARHAEKHPEATAMQKFRPHLFFNAGRIISYAALGGLLGSLGSFLQLSGTTMGAITILVGIAMLMLGFKLIGIFPRLENSGLMLPKVISRMLGIKNHEKEYSHRSSFITGALTFFLPCGFTQAMQLYAVSTGSFLQGGLIMGVFALGTAPGLLGVGGITSAVKGIFAKRFFKFAGVVVIMLSLVNISNGYTLTGWQIGTGNNSQAISDSSGTCGIAGNNSGSGGCVGGSKKQIKPETGQTQTNGTAQVIKTTYTYSADIQPNTFTVKAGTPVRFEVDVKEDGQGCMSTIMVPGLYNTPQLLQKNVPIVMEFTPVKAGQYNITCAMGVPRGIIKVE